MRYFLLNKYILIISIILFAPFFANAKPAIKAILKPQEIATYIKSDTPHGSADFTWYLINVYKISLWTDAQNFSLENKSDEKFALSINYKIKIKRDDLVQTTIDEMARISGKPALSFEKYRSTLQKVFPQVKAKDVITAINIPNKGIKFFYNGIETGIINDKNFTKNFFSIWLSEKTLNQKLYKNLINK
jgi:hypothetical protein